LRNWFFFITAIVVVSLSSHANDDTSLRVLINSKLREPYYFYADQDKRERDLPTRGIMIDIQTEIARRIKRKPVWRLLPRSQIEDAVLTGQADVQCFIDKRWTERPQDYFWSDTVLVTTEWVIANKNSAITALSAFRDKRIGTIVQYRYPELDALFGQHWRRDDADSDEVNLNKLQHNRVDAVVISDLALQYWQKHQRLRSPLNEQRWLLGQHDLRCLIAPRNASLQLVINDALAEMKKTQRIQMIVNAYLH
jgi:ABC-type amino acid transport substrate-binding protein